MYSAALLYIPKEKKYVVRAFAHVDSRVNPNAVTLAMSLSGLMPNKGDYQLLYRRECSSEAEAHAWATGLLLYTYIDAKLRGTSIEFKNMIVMFSVGAWKVVRWLAKKRNFRIAEVTGKRGSPADGYALYFKNQELDSQDHQSTVYKAQVDELIYIGEHSIKSTKRKKVASTHKLPNEPTSCGQLVQRLLETGRDPEPDFVTIGECTKTCTSQYLPEAMTILVYCAKWDLLRIFENKLVNKKLSTTTFNSSWFEEIQYYLGELTGGRTIEIVKEEGFDPNGEMFVEKGNMGN